MKKIILTGAGNGIGKVTAQAAVAEGYYVIAIDKDEAGLENLMASCTAGHLETRVVDLAETEQVLECIPTIYERHDTIQALINNAGLYHGRSINDYTDEALEEIWKVNLKAPAYLSRDYAKKEMPFNQFRSIINITSVAGEVGSYDAPYAATKAGLVGLTKANAWNFAPSIRVNTIAPALIRETAPYDRIPPHRTEEYLRQEILKDPIFPQGVADVILFFLSEKSKHITGKLVAVDNGVYPR